MSPSNSTISSMAYVMIQVVSHQPLTAEARFFTLYQSLWYLSGQIGTRNGFLRVLQLCLVRIILPMPHTQSSTYLWSYTISAIDSIVKIRYKKKQHQTFLNPTRTSQYLLHAIMSTASLMFSKAPFWSPILFIPLLFIWRIISITSLYPVWEEQCVYIIRVHHNLY